MLQGNDRFDRLLKWQIYLQIFYDNTNVHTFLFPRDMLHNSVQTLKSKDGKCLIFNICRNNPEIFPESKSVNVFGKGFSIPGTATFDDDDIGTQVL